MKKLSHLNPTIHFELTDFIKKSSTLENIQVFKEVIELRIDTELITIIILFNYKHLLENKKRPFHLTYKKSMVTFGEEITEMFEKQTGTFLTHDVMSFVEDILNNK